MKKCESQSQRIIERERSYVVACDNPEIFPSDIRETRLIPEIGGFKAPAVSGFMGWQKWVKTGRSYTDKPFFYDHQKGGTDVPDTYRSFIRYVKKAGFDAIILYPRLDDEPETHEFFFSDALNAGLKVMAGGKMTHQNFNAEQYGRAFKIYETAFKMGVRNFGVPANSQNDLEFSSKILKKYANKNVDFFPIGIGPQGGNIEDVIKLFGKVRFHPIIGRLIYESDNIHQTALDLASKLY